MPIELSEEIKTLLEEAAEDAITELMEDGELTSDEAVDLIVGIIEQVLDFKALLGPVLGSLAEEYDDEILTKVVALLAELLKRDPAKMRARADLVESRGRTRRAERIRKRADRVEERQLKAAIEEG